VETRVSAPSCGEPSAAARIVVDDPTRTVVNLPRRAGPGRLVLADVDYPGWTAEVDGRSVPIAAANVAFRSVAVPAGARRVEFRYRPASVRAGLWISGLAWALVAALAVLALRGGRRAGGRITPARRGRRASTTAARG